MTDRDRCVARVLGQPTDRVPYYLFWTPWFTTSLRWAREGMPANVGDPRSLFDPDAPPQVVEVNCGPCPALAETILEESADSVTYTDVWGIKCRRFKDKTSMPEFLEFPVKSRRDWERYEEEFLDPDHPGRLAGNWREDVRGWLARGYPIQLGTYPYGLYGLVRWLLGDEDCLVAFCTQPDLVHEIMDRATDIYLTVFEAVAREVCVDVMHMWEDMCGRQGPLISPQQWDEFLGPNYRRLRAFAKEHDIPVFSVDTDGKPDLIIPPMMAAGVNYLYPFEVAAGCDVNEMGPRFPGLAMMGGIDKRALAQGPKAIDAELDRIWPAVERFRYIPELDHLVPDDVSWDNYCYYATSLKKRIGKE